MLSGTYQRRCTIGCLPRIVVSLRADYQAVGHRQYSFTIIITNMKFHFHLFRPAFLFAAVALSVVALSFTAPTANTSVGDSELTLLMRQMYDDTALMKVAVKKRQKPVPGVQHDQLLSAVATEGKQTKSPAYQAMGQAYLKALNELLTAAPNEAKDRYKNLIDSCMSCHTTFCPGPKMRIEKLY
jgi:hypothetical protein